MKRHFGLLSTSVAVLFGICVTAIAAPLIDANRVGPLVPRIEFGHTAFDFGLRPPGKSVVLTHAFPLTNTGTAPLHILEIGEGCRTKASCKERVLSPGEATTITLVADLLASYTESQNFERVIDIRSDDPVTPNVALKVTATFANSLVWLPEKIDFGTFPATADLTTTLTVVSRLPASFRVKRCTARRGLFHIAVDEREPSETSASNIDEIYSLTADAKTLLLRNPQVSIHLRAKPDMPIGPFWDTLEIETDRSDMQLIQIPISGCIAAGLAVEPPEVFFGLVRSASLISKEVLVTGLSRDLAFGSLESSVPGVLGKAKKTEEGYRLTLTLDPAAIDGPFEGEVVLRLMPTGETKIKVSGLVQSPSKQVKPR